MNRILLEKFICIIILFMNKVSQQMVALDEYKMQEILRAWKSKSLNSMPTEKYRVPLSNSTTMPEPKIVKVKDAVFCISLNSELMVFIFATQQEKLITRTKTTFRTLNYSFDGTVKFVEGNNSDSLYVGLQHQLHILKFQLVKQMTEQGKQVNIIKQVKKIDVKNLPKLKGVSFIKDTVNPAENSLLIAVTADKLFKYSPQNNYKLLSQYRISFLNTKDQQLFSDIITIKILSENNVFLYLFASKQGLKQDMSSNKSQVNPRMRQCQILYLTKFDLTEKNPQSISTQIQMIDYAFEIGMFGKSKIFQEGPSVFLISLHQEIIVVKQHFQKYVVWDSISLTSRKGSQKKGQLILADNIVMVHSRMGEIFAHNIYFSFSEAKLKYPRIDSFRGNDNEEEVLYDAIVLQYQPGSFMKVLFYFKLTQIYSPSNKMVIHKLQKNNTAQKYLNFNVLCIQQNSPLLKLGQFFKNRKTPEQIAEFAQRFNIAELDRSKCQWSVSQKTEKDIQNLLLEIKDNQYIQNQLTKILKSASHDLKFLSRIQKKQIQRYKQMLVTKLLRNDQEPSQNQNKNQHAETGRVFTEEQTEEIKLVIKWVMESIMFEKKLVYSKKFREFMEYDFIEIGKLKAASLKEQIKLLSSTGLEKRMQYFLNSFKYMVLANFQDIFQFLIENKNEQEVQQFFIISFPFILPKFKEVSQIFKKKNPSHFFRENQMRKRRISFVCKIPQTKEQKLTIEESNCQLWEDHCQLWEDKFSDQNQIKKIETKQSFRKQIQSKIQQGIKKYKAAVQKQMQKSRKISPKQCLREQDAKRQFSLILDQFVGESWFLSNKLKQHSIIQLGVKQLQQKMQHLKRIGVFHLLIKFFYEKISRKQYSQNKVDQILSKFRKQNLIPESFQYNVLARREVYFKIKQKKKSPIDLPSLQNFLTYQQANYFDYLFKYYKQLLLRQVKGIYDRIPGFFKEKFQIYLDSNSIVLSEAINFLDEFESNSDDDIRMDVFNCIKKLLKVNDKENTISFVNKLMDKEILKNQGSIDSLIDQAKVTFGCYFYDFFETFQIDHTYKQLIDETNAYQYSQCKIIHEILQKYSKDDYPISTFDDNQIQDCQGFIIKLEQRYGLEQIEFQLTNQPQQFFGVVLYFIDTLRFKIRAEVVFDKFVELLLEAEKYDQLVDFIECLRRDFGEKDNDQVHEQYNEQQLKTKNYQLLKQFYSNEDIGVKDRVIQNIIQWVRKQQNQGFKKVAQPFSTEKYQKWFGRIVAVFAKVVDQLKLTGAEILREKSFLGMLKAIKQVQPKLVSSVMKQRFENFDGDSTFLNELSDFTFMVRLLKQTPKQTFDEVEQTAISRQLSAMQTIHFQFVSASKSHQQQHGLVRFYMELVIRLLQSKQFCYCKQVLLKTIQQQYYFRDVFFHFMAELTQNQKGKPSTQDFQNFIKNFIQTTHEKNMRNQFNNFIQQNQIKQFQNGAIPEEFFSTEKQNKFIVEKIEIKKNKFVITNKNLFAMQIFLTLIETNRIDQAYYFLVRSTKLSVTQAKNLDDSHKQTQSYALISTYIKCLQNYLCQQFYPTFSFYRKKHAMLLNEHQRKDIIKDINIAMSKLKQMDLQLKLKIGQYMRTLDTAKNSLAELMRKQLPSHADFNEQLRNSEIQTPTKIQQPFFSTKMELLKQKQKQLEIQLEELTEAYDDYTSANSLNPTTKLNQSDQPSGANYTLKVINQEMTVGQLKLNQNFDLEDSQAKQSPRFDTNVFAGQSSKNIVKDNESRQKYKIAQNPKFTELKKQVNEQLREAKKLTDKHEQFTKTLMKPLQPSSKNIKIYNELKEKQKKQLESLKKTYKSQASQRVDDILKQIRLRKSKLYPTQLENFEINSQQKHTAELQIPTNNLEKQVISQQPGRNQLLLPPPEIGPSNSGIDSMLTSGYDGMSGSRKYQVKLHGVDGNTKDIYMPVTMNKSQYSSSQLPLNNILTKQEQSLSSSKSKIIQNRARSQMKEPQFNPKSHIPKTFQQLLKLFQQKQPQCKKYVQKLQLVKSNVEIGLQIAKTTYSTVKNFSIFVKLLGYLLENSQRCLEYKKVLEEKAYKIALQSVKIDCNVNLKELFPMELFTQIKIVSQTEYYKCAYEIIKSNLAKMLAKPQTNVHNVAILFRFCFGYNNIYAYGVYQDYMKVLLKIYCQNTTDQRQLFLLGQNLRTNYAHISPPQTRQIKFEKLLKDIPSQPKRKTLVKEMIRILDMMGKMVTAEEQSDLKEVLMRLQ